MSTDKTCIETGSSVIDMLMEQGLMVGMTEKANLPNDVKIEKIAKHMKEIIETLGYDLSDEELSGTPLRIPKMWVNDWFVAWDPKKFPKCTTFKNKGADSSFTDEMVIVRNINVMSNCAHHFTTTDIKVDVGYVVNSEMIGLSK